MLGPIGPAGRSSQFAGRPQAALDSNAAARQQTQNDDIASSNPRLVKKGPIRGLRMWLIAT